MNSIHYKYFKKHLGSARNSLLAAYYELNGLVRVTAVTTIQAVRHPIQYFRYLRMLRKLNRGMQDRLDSTPKHEGTDRSLPTETTEERDVKSTGMWASQDKLDDSIVENLNKNMK